MIIHVQSKQAERLAKYLASKSGPVLSPAEAVNAALVVWLDSKGAPPADAGRAPFAERVAQIQALITAKGPQTRRQICEALDLGPEYIRALLFEATSKGLLERDIPPLGTYRGAPSFLYSLPAPKVAP